MKHTPGPWTVLTAKHPKYGAVLHEGFPAVHKDEGDGVPWCLIAPKVTGPDLQQAHANARLIAAAPEMLSTLQRLESHLRGYEVVHPELGRWADEIRALLARIEGRA